MQADGIAAGLVRLPAGGHTSGFDPSSGGGQFYVVFGGEMVYGANTLHHWESVFVSCDEAALSIRAGNNGLEVLCLQMAPKDLAYVAAKRAAMAGPANA